MKRLMAVSTVLALLVLTGAAGAEVFVYPKQGQGQDQFQKDQFDCHNWAQGQTGVIPRNPYRSPPRRRNRAERSGAVPEAPPSAPSAAPSGGMPARARRSAPESERRQVSCARGARTEMRRRQTSRRKRNSRPTSSGTTRPMAPAWVAAGTR